MRYRELKPETGFELSFGEKLRLRLADEGRSGMEMVQVAILIAIAVTLGLIFKNQIGAFVNKVFGDLMGASF